MNETKTTIEPCTLTANPWFYAAMLVSLAMWAVGIMSAVHVWRLFR
jgi:hypothetical protein